MKSKIIALGIALVLLASGMGIVSAASSDVYIPYDNSYEVSSISEYSLGMITKEDIFKDFRQI